MRIRRSTSSSPFQLTFLPVFTQWNRPVHAFLLRHVYAETMASYKLSKLSAAFVTFLFSACVHELVMAVVTKKLRLYLFSMQVRAMAPYSRLQKGESHHILMNLDERRTDGPTPAHHGRPRQDLPQVPCPRQRTFLPPPSPVRRTDDPRRSQLFFWLALLSGFPLLGTLYLRY